MGSPARHGRRRGMGSACDAPPGSRREDLRFMVNGVTDSVHAAALATARPGVSPREDPGEHTARAARTDALELSETARKRLEPDDSAPIRHALVERVRSEIAAGAYLTEQKIDVAVNRLHQMLFPAA